MRQSENSSGSSPILNERLRFAAKGKGRAAGKSPSSVSLSKTLQLRVNRPPSSPFPLAHLIAHFLSNLRNSSKTRNTFPLSFFSFVLHPHFTLFTSVGLAKWQLSGYSSSSSSSSYLAAVAESAVAVTATL